MAGLQDEGVVPRGVPLQIQWYLGGPVLQTAAELPDISASGSQYFCYTLVEPLVLANWGRDASFQIL